MKNIFLIVLDSVRRDYFYKSTDRRFFELEKDFVHFKNCYSIYTATCRSHYSMFFGDYFNKSGNDSFPAQLKQIDYNTRSFCNGAIVTGYPLKDIEEEKIKNNRPYRAEMIRDLGITAEFDWQKEMFGNSFADYYGAADDEARGVPTKWKTFLEQYQGGNQFVFLHFWNAHYIYDIGKDLNVDILGRDYKEIGNRLIQLVKAGEISEDDVKTVYSKRIDEMINIYLRDLVSILKCKKIYDDSLIIVTSDHGEGLGDIRVSNPSFDRFKFEAYYHNLDHDFQREIPLSIKFPGNEFGGFEVEDKVSLFDLIHTINDCVGNKLEISGKHGESLCKLLKTGIYSPKIDKYETDDSDEEFAARLSDLGYL